MASSISEGTLGASPFIGQYVDILREHILVRPDDFFETAEFEIEYHLNALQSGQQIPLLFYASDYLDSFRVWVDGHEVPLIPVPKAYAELEGTPFADFAYLFESDANGHPQQILLSHSPESGYYLRTDDLKFFEIDLTEGEHVIRAEYRARHWRDRSDWVMEYSFRYALSPARYWKSFGELEILLDLTHSDFPITTNLDAENGSMVATDRKWHFIALPTEVFTLTYTPEISSFAKALIAISPSGIALLWAVFLVVAHYLAQRHHRKKNPNTRYSWLVIAGSTTVPFLALMGYLYAFNLIDAAIGEYASHYHGYTFLVLVFYPMVMPVYWVIMWLLDRAMARRIRSEAALHS